MQILRPESERLKQNLEGVCLHSYNDTVSVNTGVIIERCFRGFPSLEGAQILDSYIVTRYGCVGTGFLL